MNPAASDQPVPLTSIPAEISQACDYERLAPRFISHPSFEYIAGGCGQDQSVRENLAAYRRWHVYPRVLREVADGHTRLQLIGQQLDHPLLLAPVAFQKLVHPNGELDSARAARATGTCLLSSTLASCTLEDIAGAAGPQRWFQLYFQSRENETLALVRRAEAAGYGAIVVTLDAAIQVASQRALRAGFQMPQQCTAANLQRDDAPAPTSLAPGDSRVFQGLMRQAPGWRELRWLKQQTRLPIWVKGISHADDALALVAAGVSGIVVSNHGGRSLDGAPASLDMLPAIRQAVGRHYPLLLDGGLRSGSDVFKALALGADAVLIGRLQLYALAVAGALGVAHMLKLLREELEVIMALAGCATLADIGPGCLWRASHAGG